MQFDEVVSVRQSWLGVGRPGSRAVAGPLSAVPASLLPGVASAPATPPSDGAPKTSPASSPPLAMPVIPLSGEGPPPFPLPPSGLALLPLQAATTVHSMREHACVEVGRIPNTSSISPDYRRPRDGGRVLLSTVAAPSQGAGEGSVRISTPSRVT